LPDIARAVRAAAIDWPRFWREAEARGWAGGARLIFALTGKYMGPPGSADPAPAPVPDALVARAEALMLQDMDARAERGFATHRAEAEGAGGRAALLLRRAFRPRHIVAHYAGVPAHSWRVWPAYPVRMADNAWQWLRRRGDAGLDDEVADMRAVRAWLGTGR